MMTSIGFYLSGLIAAGIIFIGCRFYWRLQQQRRVMAYRLASNRIRERIYPLKAFVTLHRDCSSQSLWLTGQCSELTAR